MLFSAYDGAEIMRHATNIKHKKGILNHRLPISFSHPFARYRISKMTCLKVFPL